jgi:propionate CoA-transferase
MDDVMALEREVEALVAPLGHRVAAIVNYDHFEIAPEVEDEYAAMVKRLEDRYYTRVTRFSTSGFLRAKLGAALKRRDVAPHVYESAEEALRRMRDT